jgi:hypothetical protein
MTMLNNGNVGIGITNPTQLLTVVGNSRFNGVIDMSTSGVLSWSSGNAEISQNSNDIIFKTYTGSALTEKFRIKNLGNIGIGTTAPAAKLHTIGTIQSGTVAKVTVDSVNAVRLSGNATVWDDLMMPFSTGTTAGTGYPTYNADSMYHSFVVDTTGPSKCIIYMPIQLPHKWKEGSTIYPHIHYRHSTTQGTPTFRIKYKWVNIGATTGTWNWYTMSTTTGTTNLTHQMVYNATGISGSGNTISSMLLMQIYLVNTSTATKTCDAFQFDIHVEQDALGSNSETSKN